MKKLMLLIGVVVVFMVAGLWISPIGYLTVKIACREDGGEFIYQKVFANGYSIENQGSRCMECLYDIASKRFEFVDHDIRTSGHPLVTRPGFHRYSLHEIQSVRCDRWRSSGWAVNRRDAFGLAPNECIALEPVKTPTVHRYSYSRTDVSGFLSTRLARIEYKIENTDSGETLAVVRNYEYTPLMKRIIWEWNSRIWQCYSVARPFSPKDFRQNVLRGDPGLVEQHRQAGN